MDWDKLKIFHTVAEASSFTKASTILNLSQSAISRQIQGLENEATFQFQHRYQRGGLDGILRVLLPLHTHC